MREDGVDLTASLVWGFFFMNGSRPPLERVCEELAGHGYVVEELTERDDDTWVLHVTKTEVLELEKLHRRNVAFNELAAYCEVDLYDGWDVTVPGPTGSSDV
jgi:hypothetical protein